MTDPTAPARDRLFALIASIPGSALVDWCEPARALLDEIAASAGQAPATDRAAEPRCVCGHPMQQHHEDVCLTGCGCNDGREPESTTDLPDRLAAALTARFTELGNPHSEMRRHEQGPDGWPASHPVGPHLVAEVLRELLATTDLPAAGAQQPGEAR